MAAFHFEQSSVCKLWCAGCYHLLSRLLIHVQVVIALAVMQGGQRMTPWRNAAVAFLRLGFALSSVMQKHALMVLEGKGSWSGSAHRWLCNACVLAWTSAHLGWQIAGTGNPPPHSFSCRQAS